MSNKIAIVVVFLLAVFLISSNAFAAIDLNGVSMFMTDYNSTTEKTLFSGGETPYLYIGFPSSFNSLWKSDGSLWKNPDGVLKGFTLDVVAGQDNWYTITNWDTVKKSGLWTVDAGYLALGWCNKKIGGQSLTFTFAPEPISATLFLLGGGAMAIRAFRKKNKIVTEKGRENG